MKARDDVEMVYANMPEGMPSVGVPEEPRETLAPRLSRAVMEVALRYRKEAMLTWDEFQELRKL